MLFRSQDDLGEVAGPVVLRDAVAAHEEVQVPVPVVVAPGGVVVRGGVEEAGLGQLGEGPVAVVAVELSKSRWRA